MKRIFYFILVAVLCVAACHKVDHIEKGGDKGEIAFTVSLPGSISTKTISDGEKALKLYYAAYTENGKMIESLSNVSDGVVVSGKQAQVTLKLVKNVAYDIVFWAQAADCQAFDFDWANASMTVDYNGAANDDYRDAFYAVCQEVIITDVPVNESVVLHRPFAQINFGAADYQSVVDYYDQTSVDSGMKSSLSAIKVPDTLDLLEGTVDDASVSTVDFTLAAIPNDPRLLEVEGVEYKYLSMNYILAESAAQPAILGSITAEFVYSDGNIDRTVEVANVPYLRNHRTNIIGNFFTENAIFNIVIDEKFDQPDNNIN